MFLLLEIGVITCKYLLGIFSHMILLIIECIINYNYCKSQAMTLQPCDIMNESVSEGQQCLTLCSPMDYAVRGILQARILEWVATRVGSISLLQGSFPTQGLHPGLLHHRCILCQLSHREALYNEQILLTQVNDCDQLHRFFCFSIVIYKMLKVMLFLSCKEGCCEDQLIRMCVKVFYNLCFQRHFQSNYDNYLKNNGMINYGTEIRSHLEFTVFHNNTDF